MYWGNLHFEIKYRLCGVNDKLTQAKIHVREFVILSKVPLITVLVSYHTSFLSKIDSPSSIAQVYIDQPYPNRYRAAWLT